MSFIDDALKKTQNNLDQKEQKPEDKDISQMYDKLHQPKEAAKTSQPGNQKNQPKEEKKGSPLVGIFIFVLLITGLYFVYQYYYSGDKKKSGLKQFQFTLPKASPKAPPPPKPKEYKEDEIVLNGIMATDARKAALINDKIYEIGDEIKGKKIISIDESKVEIMDTSGTITTLKTSH